MQDLDELLKKLNALPRGYISKKTIQGKKYFYLQRKENQKVVSKYIKKEDVEEIRKQLIERENLETILDNLMNDGEDLNASLNKNSKEFNGFLMSGNSIVAKVRNDMIIWKNERKCPLILLKSKYLAPFLLKRLIDDSRPNSRLLKKAMNISLDVKEENIPMYVHGAVITDNYWFRPSGSRLIYEDIQFHKDTYSDLSLKGDTRLNPKAPKKSPQLTLVGSYEKCWKLINNEWWLYKVGTDNEIFSEIFCSKFAELIGIPTAFYERDGKYIRTKNFADINNFEPISSIAGDDDSYSHVFDVIYNISPEIAGQYLELMYFDALVENADRHNDNLGLLRDRRTGKILCLAPNFDNNIALISRGNILNEDREHYGMAKEFAAFLKQNKKALELFKNIELIPIDNTLLQKCFEMSGENEVSENINHFIINGYKLLSFLHDN